MPALAVNTSVNVSLPAGSSINVTGNGAWAFIATVSGREIASGSYVGPDVIGPFTRAAVVGLTATVSDGLQYSVADFVEGNSAAAALTTEQVTALQAVVSEYRKRPACVRVPASTYAGAIAADAKCYGHAISLPVKFDAVRIGFVHSGGSGAVAGMTAAVAATDDVGDRSNTNTAAGRRFATPYRGGVEKNEFSADGWKRVTVGGANSWAIADSGAANVVNIAWSDVMEVHAIEDALFPGHYPLLVRVYGGTGAFTRVGQTGLADPAKWYTEAGANYVLGCDRVGAADAIGTLANWSNASNANFNDADLIAMIIEAWTSEGVNTVMLVGDSRFAVAAPSLEATKSYRNVGFFLEKAIAADGINATVAMCARGAQTNATFATWADQYLTTIRPTHSAYICYSINNGVPTAALLATERTRTLRHLESCRAAGVKPILLPIFPYSTGFGSVLSEVLAFNAWCKSLGVPVIDLLAAYGDAAGGWLPGVNEDANHQTDAYHEHLAGLVWAAVKAIP